MESEEKNELQKNINEMVTTTIFSDKTLEMLLTTLYKNLVEDRDVMKKAIDEMVVAISKNPDNLSFLKLQELETLQKNNDQMLKFSELVSDILIKKSEIKNDGVLLFSEEQRRYLCQDNDDDTSSIPELMEPMKDEDDGIKEEEKWN